MKRFIVRPEYAAMIMQQTSKSTDPWIGVDLDGTLVYHDAKTFRPDVIGKPIPPMVARVKRMIQAGKQVRIFTARVSGTDKDEVNHIAAVIMNWTLEVFGVVLPVTCRKDYLCIQIWDDRAVAVYPNTGLINNTQLDPF